MLPLGVPSFKLISRNKLNNQESSKIDEKQFILYQISCLLSLNQLLVDLIFRSLTIFYIFCYFAERSPMLIVFCLIRKFLLTPTLATFKYSSSVWFDYWYYWFSLALWALCYKVASLIIFLILMPGVTNFWVCLSYWP
jgi:hypothetical protein